MTLRLILTRHAKSVLGDPDYDDHARTLNERGRMSAVALGRWLRAKGILPEEVLCSDAARTRETFALVSKGIGVALPVRYSEALYHASSSEILAQLATARSATVQIIGHNPGIGTLASRLAATPPAHPKFGQYPTAATTVIDFDASTWSDIGRGRVVEFVVPRDLLGTDDND